VVARYGNDAGLIGAAMAAVEGDIPHFRSSSPKARPPGRRK
jgi:hypothetical protein